MRIASQEMNAEGNTAKVDTEDVEPAEKPKSRRTSGVSVQSPERSKTSARRTSTGSKRRKSYGRHSLGASFKLPQLSSDEVTLNSSANDKHVYGLNLSPRKGGSRVVKMETFDEVEEPVEQQDNKVEVNDDASDEPPNEDAQSIEETQVRVEEEQDATVLAFSPIRVIISEHNSPTTPEMTKDDISGTPNMIEPSEEPVTDDFDTTVTGELDVFQDSAEPEVDLADAFGSPVEDNTTTMFEDTTTHLELDTAHLMDFLSRTEAAKASKQSEDPALNVARRSSLQNRRDSGPNRLALASPRKPLDNKDPNSPLTGSPSKGGILDLPGVKDLAAKLPASLLAAVESVDLDSMSAEQTSTSNMGSRRSSRARSRLPAPSTTEKTPNKTIPFKRTADGSDPTAVVLKKTEAQENSILTRTNTRRNKGSSLQRLAKLKKLREEGLACAWVEGKVKEMPAVNASQSNGPADDEDDLAAWRVPAEGDKGVRWRPDSELISYFGGRDSLDATVSVAEDVTTTIPPPSSLTALSASVLQASTNIDSPQRKPRAAASRMRRLNGLGAANGTPAKNLLASSLLPDDVADEEQQPQQEQKTKLPTAAARDRKSKIATPRKLKLAPAGVAVGDASVAPTVPTLEAREKEQRRLASPRKISQLNLAGASGPSLVPTSGIASGRVRKRAGLR